MSYLPTNVIEEIKKETIDKKYIDFIYDEKTNTLLDKKGEGLEALKGWIYFALRIARYRYPIFSWNYGCELENIISKDYDDDLLKSEVKRCVKEALLVNQYIKSVDDIKVVRNDEKIIISCSVKTKFGEIYVENL